MVRAIKGVEASSEGVEGLSSSCEGEDDVAGEGWEDELAGGGGGVGNSSAGSPAPRDGGRLREEEEEPEQSTDKYPIDRSLVYTITLR